MDPLNKPPYAYPIRYGSTSLQSAVGTKRARYERRDERRDTAIAEIYGALTRLDRDLISWSKPQEAGLSEEPAWSEWRERVERNLETFLDCYYTRLIWLDDDTKRLIHAYAHVARKLFFRLENYMDKSGRLTNGDRPEAFDLVNNDLEPAYGEVEDKLRNEFNIRRRWYHRWFGR
jgi:hypothetical protein